MNCLILSRALNFRIFFSVVKKKSTIFVSLHIKTVNSILLYEWVNCIKFSDLKIKQRFVGQIPVECERGLECWNFIINIMPVFFLPNLKS